MPKVGPAALSNACSASIAIRDSSDISCDFRIAVALMNGVNGNYVNACEKEERPDARVASSNQETGNLFRYSWPSRKAIEA